MCVCRVGCGSWLFVRWGLVGGGGVVVEDGQDSRNASPVSTCHGLDVKEGDVFWSCYEPLEPNR